MNKRELSMKMRVYHRYLGFFLTGIMFVYAVSGIMMIFRTTDTFKISKHHDEVIATGLSSPDALGQALKIRGLKITGQEGDVISFPQGTYNAATGQAVYTVKQLPYLLDKMEHMHKATVDSPLFFLNIFFGLSLFFFVLSSFWMFLPGTNTFKKGIYFALGGVVLTLIMLFV